VRVGADPGWVNQGGVSRVVLADDTRVAAADYDRTPPQDVPAEQSVLGGMLLSKDAIADVVEVLRPTDFYRPAHQLIYDAVLDLYARGEPADAVTVSAELTRAGQLARVGGAAYLHTLIATVPTAANAGYYAQIVGEKAILRRLVTAGTRIVQMGYQTAAGSGDLIGSVDDVVDRAQAEIYDVTERRTSDDYVHIESLLTGTLTEIERIADSGGVGTGIPTGFTRLDEITNGLHPGQMITVAGRPGSGKSTLALDFARSAAIRHRKPTVLFSLEMGKLELMMRLLSAEALVPLRNMRSGHMADQDWARLARRAGDLAEAPLFLDDSPNLTMMEIRAKARRLRQRHDLQLIVIDYLQLMTSGKRVESRQQEVSEFSRAIKLLAKELDVPVVALSQLNRGPEQRTDKRPMLADLRESGCLTADTTLLRADTGAPITFRELLDTGHTHVLVWSLDEQRRLVAAPVTDVFPSGVKAVFRLRLASGREVKATGNHPFLTFDGWAALDALHVGDRIAVPRRIPEPVAVGLGWSEHRLGLLAHLISDGCLLRSLPVHHTSDDEANLAFVEAAAAEEFGITPARVAHGRWWRSYLPAPHRHGRGLLSRLRAWFRELGIDDLRSEEKRLPEAIYSASNPELAVFLRHLWASGGCLRMPGAGGSSMCKVYYATSSRALADGVMRLLARFGIVARLSVVKHGRRRATYHVLIADAASLRTFCQEIGVHGRRGHLVGRLLAALRGRPSATNVDTLPHEAWQSVQAERLDSAVTERQLQAAIGTPYRGASLYRTCPSRERMQRLAEVLDSDLLRATASDDVFWDQVVDIEPLGKQPVYDATVKGTHNFVADGIIAHNSIEQDSDVVLLVHREDMYERESPRAGEADLIIAKHRNGPTATVAVSFQGHYSRFSDMPD
jgi:replicative DNA helicase